MLTVTSTLTKSLSPSSDEVVAVSVIPVPSVALLGATTMIRIIVVSFSATNTHSEVALKLKEVTVSEVTSIVKLRLAPRL